VIYHSEKLQKENLNISLSDFFSYTDLLFHKQLKEEEEQSDNNQQYKELQEKTLPLARALFNATEFSLENLFEDGKNKCLKKIEKEISNIEKRLNKVNNNIKIAGEKIQKKIEKIVEQLKVDLQKVIDNLIDMVQKNFENCFENLKNKKIHSKLSINLNKVFNKLLLSTITSTIKDRLMEYPFGFLIGYGGVPITFGLFISNLFNQKETYKKGLEACKDNLKKKIEQAKIDFLSDFVLYKNYFFNLIAKKLQIISTNLNVDKEIWEAIKIKYNEQKEVIMNEIKSLHNK
jgi:hypothetical protein